MNPVKNKNITDIVMIPKVIHPTKFEKNPLVLSLSIFLSLPILRIIKIIGIAMIPLITEAYISAWIMWVSNIAIKSPIDVENIIII